MAKRKATKRTQRKARGKGASQRKEHQPEIAINYPGVTIYFPGGEMEGIYHGPPKKDGGEV